MAPPTYRSAMNGARIAVTLPIRRMPPMITMPTTAAPTIAVQIGWIPKADSIVWAIVFD